MQDQTASGTGKKVQSRFLEISDVGDRIQFSYDHGITEKIGLRLREKEVHWMVKSRLGRLGTVSPGVSPHSFLMANEVLFSIWIKNVLIELDQNLNSIANRPLTHRMVEQLLGITARERLRWTKDGRLPRSGHASF